MSPDVPVRAFGGGGFPRVSGDEPGGLEIDGIPGPFSPRERG